MLYSVQIAELRGDRCGRTVKVQASCPERAIEAALTLAHHHGYGLGPCWCQVFESDPWRGPVFSSYAAMMDWCGPRQRVELADFEHDIIDIVNGKGVTV
jgi:hypothetical protein